MPEGGVSTRYYHHNSLPEELASRPAPWSGWRPPASPEAGPPSGTPDSSSLLYQTYKHNKNITQIEINRISLEI